MKPLLNLAAISLLLTMSSTRCLAMMEIEDVSADRARQLGIQVQTVTAGPRDLRITISFDVKGDLKEYSRVDLEVRDGGQSLVSATLRDERSAPGRVVVSFSADRLSLDKLTVRIVTQHSPRTRTGHDLRMKEFVELEKRR